MLLPMHADVFPVWPSVCDSILLTVSVRYIVHYNIYGCCHIGVICTKFQTLYWYRNHKRCV